MLGSQQYFQQFYIGIHVTSSHDKTDARVDACISSLEGSIMQLLHGHAYSVMETIAATIHRKLSRHDLMSPTMSPYITTKSAGPITNCVGDHYQFIFAALNCMKYASNV